MRGQAQVMPDPALFVCGRGKRLSETVRGREGRMQEEKGKGGKRLWRIGLQKEGRWLEDRLKVRVPKGEDSWELAYG